MGFEVVPGETWVAPQGGSGVAPRAGMVVWSRTRSPSHLVGGVPLNRSSEVFLERIL